MVLTNLLLWGWREKAVATSVGTKERTCSMMGHGGLISVTQLGAASRPDIYVPVITKATVPQVWKAVVFFSC